MTPPKVSVCIPTYNYARFLPEAIQSILNQSFTDFELLIIDDCSTDDTADVVQKFAAQDARIRFLINTPNLGMVNNWNLCLREARGEFIKFVFGDDLLTSPDALRKMMAPLLADQSISLVASARDLVCPESKTIRTRSSFGKTTVIAGNAMIRRCLLEQKNLIGEPTMVMFRKKDAARGFNQKYRQIVDMEMWYHLLEQGQLAYLNEPLCAFRCHPDQQTEHNSRSTAMLDDTKLLLAEYLRKPYLHFGSVGQTLIIYNFCYLVWKAHRKNKVSKDYIVTTINNYGGYTKFRLLLPFYKIVRPCCKLIHYIFRKLGNHQPLVKEVPQIISGRITKFFAGFFRGGLENYPLVSVIVPTYCRPEMLKEAVESILNQSYRDFEVIVINDGGPDVSDVLASLRRPDKIVYLRHNKKLGRSNARNTGLTAAKGKYIAYLDDDDIYHRSHLKRLVSILVRTGMKVAYSDAYRAKQSKVNARYVVIRRRRFRSRDFDREQMLIGNYIPNLCILHEKACLDVAGVFDPALSTHEDWDLWIRLSQAFEFKHLKRITCEFRLRDDQTNTTSAQRADFLRTAELIYQRYESQVGGNQRVIEGQKRFLKALRDELAAARA